MPKKITTKKLKKLGIPKIYWAGLILASMLGFSSLALQKYKDFYNNQRIFSKVAIVESIEDGDTFVIKDGLSVRMIGINSPGGKSTKAYDYLQKNLPAGKRVYLEYDRYLDDKFGRLLAWVWVDCESTPQFLPADYMHKSNNESNPGLTENPKGCKNGKLVNEELVKSGLAKPEFYKDRGELKYQKRISGSISF